MSEEQTVLIVDSNVAFATILQEGLEQGGEYRTAVASSGEEVHQALSTTEFDLVIVDLGLDEPDGATLARTLREQHADLRLMLIPLMGEDLPSDLIDLDIQGVLPKPFFFPELPGRIADALARPFGEGVGTVEAPVAVEPVVVAEPSPPRVPAPVVPEISAERVAAARKRIPEERLPRIARVMDGLVQDVNADAVILTCEGVLIAHAGRLSVEEVEGLAQAVAESWHTSARVAKILGREQIRFEQSVEGGEHMFYSLAVDEDIILSTALRASVALGMIRHRAKSTADKLRDLCGPR
jgi:CheY-like chemotaxis protein